MDTSKITVTTSVNDADLNDIHIHLVLSGRTTRGMAQAVYVVGQVNFNRDDNRYHCRVDDHVSGQVDELNPCDDVRHALDAVTGHLIEFAVANDMAGAQSLRILQKD